MYEGKGRWVSGFEVIVGECRYTDMTKQMLESWFKEEPFPDESFYIVREGKLADQYSK